VHDNVQLSYIFAARTQWLSSIQSSYESDHVAQEMLTKFYVDSEAIPNFTLKMVSLGTNPGSGLVMFLPSILS
jgi:hypothetical protein